MQRDNQTPVHSIDARTGADRGAVALETTPSELDAVCARATAAFRTMRRRDRTWRGGLLRALADGLEQARRELVDVADAETALGPGRLGGELTRTCYQLELFAQVVLDGGYLEATIDHAGESPMGPRPDLRRMLVPIGAVAVFGASNFPFAFSVPGGDVASALAAGCPVVVKAHESHPQTSQRCATALATAARAYGAPGDIVQLVHGRDAGIALVRHPAIAAVGFTGSRHAGEALLQAINTRPVPIPFYGELSSLNPLIVTAAAAADRGADIGRGLAGSFTLGGGQFCTKPGLAFVPQGDAGDRLVGSVLEAAEATTAPILLNGGIANTYTSDVKRLLDHRTVTSRIVAAAPCGSRAVPVQVLETDAADLGPDLLREHFGPVTVIARYRDDAELVAALTRLPNSLTATIHLGPDEPVPPAVTDALRDLSGRIVFNGYPTGVAVSWAQHHGGGWPATNSLHTSVGPTAIRRFLRPLAWQDAPAEQLPVELQEETRGLPRRVDGVLEPHGGPDGSHEGNDG